jgi:prolyl-tRNA editing enzyme YbaK/EbsC (Cys-tRNA(Pro) deacylase)
MTGRLDDPVTRARERLDAAGVEYQLVEHARAETAADEADAAGNPPAETAKTLVLLDHDQVRVAVIPASRRLDLDRVRRTLGASRHLRLATEAEAAGRFPAYEVGALPPFAAEAAPEVIDARLLYREAVLCPAGDHRHSVMIDPRDLFRITEARVADICEHDPAEHRFAEVPRI